MESETGNRSARDRRRHPRFAEDANALCMMEAGTGFHQARLTEISLDGMRIQTSCAFRPGSQIYSGVFLEAREPLVLLGVVQHCEAEGGSCANLGIQFLGVTDDQRTSLKQLQEYLQRRHGAPATVVTLHPAPAILRVGQERWW